MKDRVGDGVFRYVSVARYLSWHDEKAYRDAAIRVQASAECPKARGCTWCGYFVEPDGLPKVPDQWEAPKVCFPMQSYTREQWQELKQAGDQAWADFDSRFARVR
jgi:hypothetical protein